MTSRFPLARTVVLAALLATTLLTFGAAPASAAKPCWKQLLNDWYDGRIDKAYPVKCYREAIRNLPKDVQEYSSAREDINRALLAAIRSNGSGPIDPNQVVEPRKPSPAEVRGDGGRRQSPFAGKPPAQTESGPTSTPEREADGGPIDDFLRDIGPNNVDSLPLPILVLAGIAFLLFGAAAASWVARRIQARRVPVVPGPPPGPRDRP